MLRSIILEPAQGSKHILTPARPSADSDAAQLGQRLRRLGPVAAAAVYPLLLAAFHEALSSPHPAAPVAAALLLAAAFAVPIFALAGAARLGALAEPSRFDRGALRLCLLAVGAPPLFVFAGVASGLLGLPVEDLTVWLMAWSIALLAVLAMSDGPALVLRPPAARTRMLHGALAALLLTYIVFHLGNHLAGWLGPDAHARVMDWGRAVYRSRVVEPLLVAGLLGQVALGVALARRWTAQPLDRLRALQVGSGVYVGLFALTHLNSAFVSARWIHGTATDWAWASGAPEGLIADAWNIRLLPHYALGVFFLLTHLACGARVVLAAHGASAGIVAWVWRAGLAAALVTAALIVAALCGARLYVADAIEFLWGRGRSERSPPVTRPARSSLSRAVLSSGTRNALDPPSSTLLLERLCRNAECQPLMPSGRRQRGRPLTSDFSLPAEFGRKKRVAGRLAHPREAAFFATGVFMISYKLSGLDPAPFRHLFGLADAELRTNCAVRYTADQPDAFPDRVELRDVDPGERVLLVNYVHQPAPTPYRAGHAIFVREGAEAAKTFVDELPRSLLIRPLSLRAFSAGHMMVDGDVLGGSEADSMIQRMLGRPDVAYIHVHFARRGCYAGLIERA